MCVLLWVWGFPRISGIEKLKSLFKFAPHWGRMDKSKFCVHFFGLCFFEQVLCNVKNLGSLPFVSYDFLLFFLVHAKFRIWTLHFLLCVFYTKIWPFLGLILGISVKVPSQLEECGHLVVYTSIIFFATYEILIHD